MQRCGVTAPCKGASWHKLRVVTGANVMEHSGREGARGETSSERQAGTQLEGLFAHGDIWILFKLLGAAIGGL